MKVNGINKYRQSLLLKQLLLQQKSYKKMLGILQALDLIWLKLVLNSINLAGQTKLTQSLLTNFNISGSINSPCDAMEAGGQIRIAPESRSQL